MEHLDIYNDIMWAPTKEWYENVQYCCPFHREKTASFSINKKSGLWKCFGCGLGGNVFTFIKEYFWQELYIQKLLEYKLISEKENYHREPPYKKMFLEQASNLLKGRIKDGRTTDDIKYLFLKRRLFRNDIERYGIGTTLHMKEIEESNAGFRDFKDKAKLYDRIMIPAQTWSEPYIIGRAIDLYTKSTMKYKNDKMNKKGKMFFTWAPDYAKQKVWYLSEGVIDGIKLNKYLNKTIIHTLGAPNKDFIKRLGKKIVYTLFDNDKAAIKFTMDIINNSFLNYDTYAILYENFFSFAISRLAEKMEISGLEEKIFSFKIFDYLHSKDWDEFEEKLFYILLYFFGDNDAFVFTNTLRISKEEILDISTEKILEYKTKFLEIVDENPYLFEEIFTTYEPEIQEFYSKWLITSFVNDQEYIYLSTLKSYLIIVWKDKPNLLKKINSVLVEYLNKEYKIYIQANKDNKNIWGFIWEVKKEFENIVELLNKSSVDLSEEIEMDLSEDYIKNNLDESEEVDIKEKEELIHKMFELYFMLLPNGTKDFSDIYWNSKMFQKFLVIYLNKILPDMDLEDTTFYIDSTYGISLKNKDQLNEIKREKEEIVSITINEDYLIKDLYFYYFIYKLPLEHFAILFPSIKKVNILNDELVELGWEFEGSNILSISNKEILENKRNSRLNVLAQLDKMDTPFVLLVKEAISVIENSNISLELEDSNTPISYQQWIDSIINVLDSFEVKKESETDKEGFTQKEKNNLINFFLQINILINNYNFILQISQR